MYPFSAHEIQWPLRFFLGPGATFFDVGAHQGWVAGPAAELVGPKGHVVCFEPHTSNLEVLRSMARVCGFAHMSIVPAAVYREFGSVNFFANPLPHTSSIYVSAGLDAEQRIVPTVTLDDYVALTSAIPSVVKVDVEDAEADVLTGARQLIADHYPIFLMETRNTNTAPYEMLRNAGYRAYNLLTYDEVPDAGAVKAGRPIEDLIYLPLTIDHGPFGRVGTDYQKLGLQGSGQDFSIEVPLKPGINSLRIWGDGPHRYSTVSVRAIQNGRMVVNSADHVQLVFNPYFGCVLYASEDSVAELRFELVDVTVSDIAIRHIQLNEEEHRRQRLLQVINPFGVAL
jgi:FkbM family methyltransferase